MTLTNIPLMLFKCIDSKRKMDKEGINKGHPLYGIEYKAYKYSIIIVLAIQIIYINFCFLLLSIYIQFKYKTKRPWFEGLFLS
jgi:hypothetical protein